MQVCRQLKLPELGHGDEGLHEEEEDDDQDGVPPQEETPPMSPVRAPTSKPPPAPPPPAQNGVTGLGIVASKGVEGGLGEGIYVHSIVKDSPAEASDLFRVGDRIITVDDRPVSTHTVEQVRGMLAGQAGKTARISYEREGYGHTLKASLPRAEGRVVDGAFRRVDQPDYDPAQDPMAPLLPMMQPIQDAAISLSEILSKTPDFMKKEEEKRLTEEDVLMARHKGAQSGTVKLASFLLSFSSESPFPPLHSSPLYILPLSTFFSFPHHHLCLDTVLNTFLVCTRADWSRGRTKDWHGGVDVAKVQATGQRKDHGN